MNAIPPFVANSDDDMHCVNAVFRMVLRRYTSTDMSWEEIDAATKSVPGRGTWTICGDILLATRGIHVSNIEPVDYEELYKEGEPYLRKVFGKETANYYLERSNIKSVLPDIPEFLRRVHHETRRIQTAEIISILTEGACIGATINSSILNKKPGFALHYILLYDFDGTHFLLHDPGLPPMPSRKITVQEFESSFVYPGGNGGIEIFHE